MLDPFAASAALDPIMLPPDVEVTPGGALPAQLFTGAGVPTVSAAAPGAPAALPAAGHVSTSGRALPVIGGASPLKLTEIWRATVVGSRILSAGIFAHVHWASSEARSLSPRLSFCLKVGTAS